MNEPVTNCKQLNQVDLGTLCICAERYALGRNTYMPSQVSGIIKGQIGALSDKDIFILISDLKWPGAKLGDAYDEKCWDSLLDALRDEQKRREERNVKRK